MDDLPPMPAAATRTERLRLKIEEQILTGKLKPGMKLDEAEIGRRYGLSRTPVREAFNALMASGLVELRARQGAFVARPSHRTISEMVETMAIFEVNCARMAARRLTVGDKKAIVTAQKKCERAAKSTSSNAFYAATVEFHGAIYEACHNSFFADQARSLRQRIEPYRRQISSHPGLIQRSLAEHQSIIDAIFAMKEDDAAHAMEIHIATLRDFISAMVAVIGGPN
jgi:DNA-binding GntR family transcriptional regulator